MESSGTPALHGRWPLTGRDDRIERALTGLRNDIRTIFVYGPAGIGKTRFATAVGEHLDREGWVILTAIGSPALSAVPFSTFAAALSRSVPDLGAMTSTGDPVALFTMAHAAVGDLAKGRRVLLVADDLSAVDTVSITLITQLVAAERLRIIATMQEGEPVPDAALPLAVGAATMRLDLPPLDIDQVEELLAAVLGDRIAHRDIVTLHGAARGNPTYIRELVLGAADDGILVRSGDHWHLTGQPASTPALHDLIRARLRRLDTRERDLVERLAVCGSLTIDEFTGIGVVDALSELEARGIISVDETGHVAAVSLAHAHYAAAVRDAMPRIRAIALLGEQAELASSRPMSPAGALRVELWRLEAGSPTDGALLLQAATLARNTSDDRTAARLLSAAIDSGVDDPAAHLLHADVLRSLGRREAALSALERAEHSAAREGIQVGMRAAIASRRAELYGSDARGTARGILLLDEIALAAPEERPGLLLARAGLMLQLLHAHDAQLLIQEAGEFLGDHPVAQAVVALSKAIPLAYLQRTDEAMSAARTAVEHASHPGAAFAARQAMIVLASVLIEADEYPAAREAAVASLHQAIRDDDQFTTHLGEFSMGRIFWLMGRLDAAARWLRDTASGIELNGPASLLEPALALHIVVACEQGDLATAHEIRSRIDAGDDGENPMTALADAWIAQLEGDTDAAAAILFGGFERVLPRGAFGTAATLLHTVVRLGAPSHTADAAAKLEALEPFAPSRRVRLQSRHARAEADGDASSLRIVGAEWERLGALLHAAECFSSAGRISRAAGLGREGSADLQRAASLIAACEGARTPLLQFTGGTEQLTSREREIASLAAQGLSSNEIAQRLFLSPRTVNNHLQSTYTKLGIRGRRELTV